MTIAAQFLLVSLGRHTGDERRRRVPPLRVADVILSDAPGLPCRTHEALAAYRMQRSAHIFGRTQA